MITSLANEKLREREDCMQRYLHEYFFSEVHNGFIHGVEIILLIKLTHQILLEEKNSRELSVRPCLLLPLNNWLVGYMEYL